MFSSEVWLIGLYEPFSATGLVRSLALPKLSGKGSSPVDPCSVESAFKCALLEIRKIVEKLAVKDAPSVNMESSPDSTARAVAQMPRPYGIQSLSGA